MTEPRAEKERSPWSFVPPLYFQQGTQYFLVNAATTTFLARMGVALETIGKTSTLLELPFQIKALWSPLVELYGTRRRWTIGMQVAVLAGLVLLAFAPEQDAWLAWTIAACAAIAIAAATHDVAADGLYLKVLPPADQARFVGIRNSCFRLGRIFATGTIVWCAGAIELQLGAVAPAWRNAFLIAGGTYALGLVACALLLPRSASDVPVRARGAGPGAPRVRDALLEYARQPRFAVVLAFIFLYRLGESLMAKMIPSFLMAEHAKGGLGLGVAEQGLAYGTIGAAALLAGGIAGGWLIGSAGLKRCIWPMALAMNAPHLLFLWAAHAQPSKPWVFASVAVEQLGYGFGFSAYMVFLLQISRRTAWSTMHYAISTGLMTLAAMLASYWSGALASTLGFRGLFLVVCLAGLPGLAVLPFVPMDDRERAK